MAYRIIDQKTDETSFGPFKAEKVTTTLCLVSMGGGKYGITYVCKYSGLESGEAHGGPIEVDGNMEQTVNDSPKVVVKVTDYKKTASEISMHIKITVKKFGIHTIFNETLGGPVSEQNAWELLLANVEEPKAVQES